VKKSLSIYVHWPFCISKCPYCDFNSHVAKNQVNQDEWVVAYINELKYFYSQIGDRKIETIYFGGGTPSLMDPKIVESIINQVDLLWGIENNVEITIEANPSSIEYNKFEAFKKAGVNRTSIGVQSLNDRDLKFLGRAHNVGDIYAAIEVAQQTFENYTFDLIYARPEQSINDWMNELGEAIKLVSNHISLYQLTIEKGTPFYKMYKDNEFSLPTEEVAIEMYELTGQYLADFGIKSYEISNYARVGYESRHNLSYWKYKDFIGIGAGAHGRYTNLEGKRFATIMHHEPKKWLKGTMLDKIEMQSIRSIDNDEAIDEMILMGLRLQGGIFKKHFRELFQEDIENRLNMRKVNILSDEGFICNEDDKIFLSDKGVLVCNKIISEIL